MGVIDFSVLETALKNIELELQPYNIVERELILNQCILRLKTEIQKNKESDVMSRTMDKLGFSNLKNMFGGETDGKP